RRPEGRRGRDEGPALPGLRQARLRYAVASHRERRQQPQERQGTDRHVSRSRGKVAWPKGIAARLYQGVRSSEVAAGLVVTVRDVPGTRSPRSWEPLLAWSVVKGRWLHGGMAAARP